MKPSRQRLKLNSSLKGPVAGDDLVQHRPETENVRARIDRLALRLLGRHVSRRPHYRAFDRACRLGIRRRCQLGQPEVEQFCRPARGDQDVSGLQIPMKDSTPVRLVERTGNLDRHPHRLLDRQRPLDCGAVDVLHHQVVRADVMQRADMRMIQCGNGARFLLKALHVLFIKNLDSDRAAKACVFGAVDLSHSSRPDHRKDFVRAEFGSSPQSHKLTPADKPTPSVHLPSW